MNTIEKEKKMNYADLVLDNGELVQIEYPTEVEDDFWESIENTMKRGDWWSPIKFNNCCATYLGLFMDRVNMRRVVGVL